jgi:homoaconitate hydratase
VQAKQPHLQIGREYTPLPPSPSLARSDAGEHDADIHLLIRKEKKGEMTTYLHGLPMEATVHLRGPYLDVNIPKHVDEVLLLAGGTGISPALQVAQIMSKREGARIHILWANRRREECLGGVSDVVVNIKTEGLLYTLKKWVGAAESRAEEMVPGHQEKGLMVRVVEDLKARAPHNSLDVQYFVDEEDTFIGQRHVNAILKQTREVSPDVKSGAKLILVSGPDGFLDYWAGKKRFQSGREVQGPLGGVLGELDLNGWKVWKI